MRIVFAIVAALLFCGAACRSIAADSSDLTGHYYLNGVREVGSELILHRDGRYQWMLAYGAADFFSEGVWRREAGQVVLLADLRQPNQPLFSLAAAQPIRPWDAQAEEFLRHRQHETAVKRMQAHCPFPDTAGLSVPDRPLPVVPPHCTMPPEPVVDHDKPETWYGGWAVIVGDDSEGLKFSNIVIEMVFADGHVESQTTGRDGMIAVPLHNTETPRKLVLRTPDRERPAETLPVPEPSNGKGAVYAVRLDVKGLVKPFFQEMTLTVQGNELFSPLLGGSYAK
jgi:hypothetical protein